MKKFNPMLLLTILLNCNEIYAQVFKTPTSTFPASSTTTTFGITPSIPSLPNQIPTEQQPGSTLNSIQTIPTTTPPVCVDSGIQGRRCGIKAVIFCKLNPLANNCQTIINDTTLIK